jgi:ATPase subunit of ABC transporter with duplicated ATPase domains
VSLSFESAPIFSCEKLSIVVDGRPLFLPLSTTVSKGQVVQICGKNGIGKSSLLRLIASEKVNHMGNVSAIPQRSETLVLPQLQSMKSHLPFTLDEVSKLLASADLSAFHTASESAMERLSFPTWFADELKCKTWNRASGGERMRALLAGVVINRSCQVLLLDEPLNHLDVIAILEVQQSLLQFFQNEGKDITVFIVSHESLDIISRGLGPRYRVINLENSEIESKESSPLC